MKYKINIRKVFQIAGKDLSKPIYTKSYLGVTDSIIEGWQRSVKGQSTPRKIPSILYSKWNYIPGPMFKTLSIHWQPDHIKTINKIIQNKLNLDNLKQSEIVELFNQDLSFTSRYLNSFGLTIVRGLARGVQALNAPCVICGSREDVEMHHVKKVSDIKGKSVKDKKLISFSRKQVPLCHICHLGVHKGNWKNKPELPK